MNRPIENNDPLDQFTEAFANLSIPTGPTPEVKQQLLEQLAQASNEVVITPPVSIWKESRMVRIFSLAAAVLVLLSSAALLLPPSSGWQSTTYAAMLEQLQDIKTLSYTTRIIFSGQDGAMVIKTYVLNQEQVREEILSEQPGEKHPIIHSVLICDGRLGKILLLQVEAKTAKITDIGEQPVGGRPTNILEKFRNMQPEDAEFLGQEVLDGKKILKYKYHKPNGHYLVWLDSESQLPVKFVIADVPDTTKVNTKFEMTDFVWNAKLDKSLFSLETPTGYTFSQEKLSPADTLQKLESGLVTMLGYYVRLNENQFPEEFNVLVFGSITKKMRLPAATSGQQKTHHLELLAKGLNRPEILEMTKEQFKKVIAENAMDCAMGGAYLGILMETQNWHYQGKGIKLGEKEKVVVWWRADMKKAAEKTDNDSIKVLFGDLRVETMTVADLTKLGVK